MLAKLDAADGAVAWKQTIGGTDDDNGVDLKIDDSNNLYLVGVFSSPSITFPNGDYFENPDDPGDTLPNSTNTFIAKFDLDGVNSWVEVLDNADLVGVSQITVSGAGEIYLTGFFLNSVTFPTAPKPTTLIETEGSGEDEESEGGYIAKMDTNGNFLWAKGFGGIGEDIALAPDLIPDNGVDDTKIYIVGTFFDGGTFGEKPATQESLASFGGQDLFVARYDATGGFDWAKAIAGSSKEGEVLIGNPNGATKNNYNPLGISYNPASGTMFVSGDFRDALSLDCITLASNVSNQSYIAELSADDEAVSCRIWNGLDADDNNWDSTDNWNGGIVPADNNSVYVPYTGNSSDNPIFNPSGSRLLDNLTIADDRTLTLDNDLPMTGKLWLIGGFVNTTDRLFDLTNTATANRVADADGNGGYVVGKIRKEFGDTNPFTFIIGTPNGYSPVDVLPQNGSGAFLSINAVQQAHPNAPNSSNRLNRYWTISLSCECSITANMTFHYLQTDVAGDESTYRLFKIESPAPPELQTATIDTNANTATVNSVSQFSDWTLAQQPAVPTAASVTVKGRVTARNRSVAGGRVSMTDASGKIRYATTNTFGYYQFTNVPAGETYVFKVRAKRYEFAARAADINEDVDGLNFAAGN